MGAAAARTTRRTLALAAAAHGLAITRLALFDLPLRIAGPPNAVDHAAALGELVRAGRRGDAVEYFEAIAHTLVYDATILGNGMLDLEQARKVRTPTLAMAAGRAAPRCSRRRCSSSSRSAATGSTTRALGLR